MCYQVFLLSFIPVVLAGFTMIGGIFKRPEFGKRSLFLFIATILFLGTGFFLALKIQPFGLFAEQGSFANVFYFTGATLLYFLSFFLLEYSIHHQRIVKSFLVSDFISAFKWLALCFLAMLIIVVVSALAIPFYKTFDAENGRLAIFFSKEVVNDALENPAAPFIFLSRTFLLIFSVIFTLAIFLTNLLVFNLQAGVIRQKRYPFFIFLIIYVTMVVLFFIFQGWGNLESEKIIGYFPFWLLISVNLLFAVRMFNEYFFQRIANLHATLEEEENRIHTRSSLMGKVVTSPQSEDLEIINNTIEISMKESTDSLVVSEYKITGMALFRREENILHIDNDKMIHGYCTPLKIKGKIKTLDKRQLNKLLLDEEFDLTKIEISEEADLKSLGEKYIKRCMKSRQLELVDPIPDELHGMQRLIGFLPIYDRDNFMGFIVLFKDSFDRFFPQEINIMKDFSGNMALVFALMNGKAIQAERNRLQGEMEVARKIQESIVPQVIEIPGYETDCFMHTATEVGGDAYDHLPTAFGHYLGIGDVSGHGLPAGIMALTQLSSFQTVMEAIQEYEKPLQVDKIYNIVNRVLCRINRDRIGSDKFMTQNYLIERNGTFVHAGTHEVGLLYKAKDGKITRLEKMTNGTAFLGLSELIDAKTSLGKFTMESGDVLVLYSDGVIEAKDNFSDQFGINRVEEIIMKYKDSTPKEIREKIYDSVKLHAERGDILHHKGNFADDITMVILKKN